MVDQGWRAFTVFSLGIVGLFGVLFVSAFRLHRNVNEPDPARYPIVRAESMLRFGGVEARIDRVLHVDLDAHDIIVAGRIRKLDPEMLVRSASGGVMYRTGSGRYGEVLVVPIGPGRDLIAVPSATGRAEAAASDSRFRARIPELLRQERP